MRGAEDDTTGPIQLNLGCGGRPLAGYLNVDLDDLHTLKERYPQYDLPDDITIYQWDLFNLPVDDNSIHEVRADSLLEHLSFLEEPKLFAEVKRVLKPGGLFQFSVPDFEKVAQLWLSAKDEWKDFFRNDVEARLGNHWFGQHSYSTESRWGYMTAMIFGPQDADGQLHKNCYTRNKIRAILKYLDFLEPEISAFRWKGDRDPMINVRAIKK